MSGWEAPGDGWREVPLPYKPSDISGKRTLRLSNEEGSSTERLWVREDPVPPLPTEPYTVIRVRWKPGNVALNDVFMLTGDRQWNDVLWRGAAGVSPQRWLLDRIIGFELLAEPCDLHYGRADLDRAEQQARRDTATAVLNDVVRQVGDRGVFHEIARDHGVAL